MTPPRFILFAFAAFVLAFIAILWGAQGFPKLTESATTAGAMR
jgi:hypothetical protein